MAIKSKIFIGSLVAATTFSAFILSSTTVSADTYTKTARIQVTSACTLTGNVATPHSRNVAIATYEYNIGETDFSAVCNDSGGFAVYAIGFTGDTDGNNKLVHSTNSSIYINTGLAESGNTSAWAMKLTAIENAATPTIHNGYSNYSLVPDDYVKVASYPSTTTASASSMFKSYYAVYISPTQSAGIYNGKVKYVMVHPSTAAKPTFDDTFAAAGKIKDATKNKYKMQDMSAEICENVDKGQQTELVDIRDGTVYRVGKLADNRCWLLDNLAIDLVSTPLSTLKGNTNASDMSLEYLKNGGGTALDQYAMSGVIDWGWEQTYSFSVPEQGLTYIDDKTSDYDYSYNQDPLDSLIESDNWLIGGYYNYCAASAGTFCYGDGTSYGTPSGGDATEDICPAGWRMPTASKTGGEYVALATAMGIKLNEFNSIEDYDDYINYRKALKLPLTGYYDSTGNDFGAVGTYWSSSYDIDELLELWGIGVLSSSDTGVDLAAIERYESVWWFGYPMRCIAK